VPKLAPGIDRDAVLERLGEEDIEAGNYVPCVHLQLYMRERYGFAEGLCPVAEDAAKRTIALPFFTGIETEDQERVVDALARALANA
jgi:dTDP-4-amino-4,6-dideoxygalactose transaminase